MPKNKYQDTLDKLNICNKELEAIKYDTQWLKPKEQASAYELIKLCKKIAEKCKD